MSWECLVNKQVIGRKNYYCEQCRKTILVNTKHNYFAGKFEGEFMYYREHSDCRAAWCELHKKRGGASADGEAFLCDDDIENDEKLSIAKNYPEVAKRLGYTSIAEIEADMKAAGV